MTKDRGFKREVRRQAAASGRPYATVRAELDSDSLVRWAGTNRERVHAVHETLARNLQHRRVAALLSRYITDDLEPLERAWAQLELVRAHATAGNHSEAVRVHEDLLAWAQRRLPADARPALVADLRTATSWAHTGRTNDWIDRAKRSIENVTPTGENRDARLETLKLLINADPVANAPQLDEARRVLSEDPSWLDADRWNCELLLCAVRIAHARGDALATAVAAMEDALDTERANLMAPPWMDHLWWRLRDLLMEWREYALAIPAIEREDDYTASLLLAAAVWAHLRDRGRALALLERANSLLNGDSRTAERFRQMPEFEDVRDDPEFLAAAGAR